MFTRLSDYTTDKASPGGGDEAVRPTEQRLPIHNRSDFFGPYWMGGKSCYCPIDRNTLVCSGQFVFPNIAIGGRGGGGRGSSTGTKKEDRQRIFNFT